MRKLGEPAAVFMAKTVRTFCYGYLGLLLPVHLSRLGMGAPGVGLAVTLTLAGSAALTWAARRPAERYGARAILIALAALSAGSALLFLAASSAWLVVAAAILGNVAVGTGETGPFLAIEQVILARAVTARRRTTTLGTYNLLGYLAAALGAAAVGLIPAVEPLFLVFLGGSIFQCAAYAGMRGGAAALRTPSMGALPSAPHIRRLAALFALDAFAGGFVLQALVAYFLHERFGLGLRQLGAVFFVTQILTAVSLLVASRCARRFGLLHTMVFSHLLSNGILVAIAFAPVAWLAVGLLWARHLLSQIDVPTRQAYVMALVEDHERETAAAVTTLSRGAAQSVTPAIAGWVMKIVALSSPFVLGGALKILYDLLLYFTFRDVTLRTEPEIRQESQDMAHTAGGSESALRLSP